MKAILVDDEPFSLQYLEGICMRIPDLEVVGRFEEPLSALTYLEANEVDLVLTDIETPGLTGIEAVRRIRGIKPDIGIIFITGYEQYALEAFRLEAVSYIMKPCGEEELKNAVKRAVKLSAAPKKRVNIRTFGLFSIFIDGLPLRFANSKARELLALLVDRGGSVVTMEQAADVLWEERAYDDLVKKLYRKAIAYLHQVFKEKDVDFFVSDRGSCHVIPYKVHCDYFELFQNPKEMADRYAGEYMAEYSWAEPTNGKIVQLIEKYRISEKAAL